MTAPAYALVTGASRGIGAALARALAAEGRNLILVARSEADLEALRRQLARPGLQIHILPADLNRDGAARVLAAIADNGWEIDLLVNNAGLGACGPFADIAPEHALEQVRVNVLATVELTRGCLPGMRQRGHGAIINVASTAAFQPVPYMAAYAATKSFLLQFSLALREELCGSGVAVMALCPGTTQTGFFAVAGARPLGPMQSPEQVAALALRGLRRGKAMVVCGGANRLLAAAVGWLPRTWAARAAGRMVKDWQTQPKTPQ